MTLDSMTCEWPGCLDEARFRARAHRDGQTEVMHVCVEHLTDLTLVAQTVDVRSLV